MLYENQTPSEAPTRLNIQYGAFRGMAGMELDPTGLYHTPARYYHPGLGRFLSEDPKGFAASGNNLFAYAGNDPINGSDPSGEDPSCPNGDCGVGSGQNQDDGSGQSLGYLLTHVGVLLSQPDDGGQPPQGSSADSSTLDIGHTEAVAGVDSTQTMTSNGLSPDSIPSMPSGSRTIYGEAGYYADKFVGRPMANGRPFRQDRFTAAMLKVPLGTKVVVTNPTLQTSVQVEVTDRGPYINGRVIDLTKTAFKALTNGSLGAGHIQVQVQVPDQTGP